MMLSPSLPWVTSTSSTKHSKPAPTSVLLHLVPPANISACEESNYCNNGNCILIKPSSRISCICNQVGNLVKLILLQNPDSDLLQALRRL